VNDFVSGGVSGSINNDSITGGNERLYIWRRSKVIVVWLLVQLLAKAAGALLLAGAKVYGHLAQELLAYMGT
jgi:hypothetical protein